MIKGLINGNHTFIVGEQSPVGLGIVKKIRKEKDKHYIVFLESSSGKQEVDVISNNLMVITKY